MFRLQITSPKYFIFKLVIMFFQYLDGLRISHMPEIGVQHMIQPIHQSLIHKLMKEIHLLFGIFQHITDNMLQHGLRQHHIVRQIRKCHLRLYHPKFRRMSCRVGIFRPEGRTECIYVFKSKSIGFHIQLSAYG